MISIHRSTFQPTRPLRARCGSHCIQFLPPPLAGATASYHDFHTSINIFNPPPQLSIAVTLRAISTHAPLAGRDKSKKSFRLSRHKFQPTRPLRARRRAKWYTIPKSVFQPTRPLRARQQKCTNHYAHFCDNRQISDAFAQNAACQGILLLFDAGKPCGFWVRTAQVISARLCFAL